MTDDLPRQLLAHHREVLAVRAIAEPIAEARGYYSETSPDALAALGFKKYQCLTPSLVIPRFNTSGVNGSKLLRPDQARMDKRRNPPRAIKYEASAGSTSLLDVHPLSLSALKDPHIPLLINESPLKGDACVSLGYASINLTGVWNWRNKLGTLDAWDDVALEGRQVAIIADSDWVSNVGVQQADRRLAAMLKRRKARVVLVVIPAAPTGEKWGVDDYLYNGHSRADLDALIADSLNQDRPDSFAAAAPVDGTQPQDRPQIDALDQDLERISEQAWQALIASNSPERLFRHGGLPSRIISDDEGPSIQALDEHRLSHEAARAVTWYRDSVQFGRRPASPPIRVMRDMLASPVIPLPPLTSIVEAPVFAPDGTISVSPGYHPNGRTYYVPADRFVVPEIPACPSQEHIREAVELLTQGLLGDFPFVTDAERAHALAMLLLPSMRGLVDGPTPMHLVEKPMAGTGATLLIDCVAHIATGRPIGAMSEARDEDEWRKRLLAKFRGGPSLILIDNLKRRLDSAALSIALTSRYIEDRELGTSNTLRLPVRCLWVASGNNPSLSSEISRRTIRIRLDAKRDRPWLRKPEEFAHYPLLPWVMKERARLVAACLTLGQAWISEGRPCPKDAPNLGMYEDWSRTMAGVLDVAGIPGFLTNLSEFYSTADSEGAAIRGFLLAWWANHQSTAVGVADLFPLATTDDSGLDLGDKGERSQKIRLGKMLADLRDRHYQLGPLLTVRIGAAGTEKRAQLWKLVASETGPPSGECDECGECFPSGPACESHNASCVDTNTGRGEKHSPHSSHSPEGEDSPKEPVYRSVLEQMLEIESD